MPKYNILAHQLYMYIQDFHLQIMNSISKTLRGVLPVLTGKFIPVFFCYLSLTNVCMRTCSYHLSWVIFSVPSHSFSGDFREENCCPAEGYLYANCHRCRIWDMLNTTHFHLVPTSADPCYNLKQTQKKISPICITHCHLDYNMPLFLLFVPYILDRFYGSNIFL